jgi:RND superfamily putative drug exporter
MSNDQIPMPEGRFAAFVSRRALAVVCGWVLIAILVRGSAPSWQGLTLDGDFDHLPKDRPSVAGERLLDAAFPTNRPRSQVAIVLAREDGPLDVADELASLDLLRRLHHRLAEVLLAREAAEKRGAKEGREASPATGAGDDSGAGAAGEQTGEGGEPPRRENGGEAKSAKRPSSTPLRLVAAQGDQVKLERSEPSVSVEDQRAREKPTAEGAIDTNAKQDDSEDGLTRVSRIELARKSLDEAIRIDEEYFEALQEVPGHESVPVDRLRLTLAYWDRSNLLQRLGDTNGAGPDMQAALTLEPEIANRVKPFAERDLDAWSSLLDLVSWNDAVLGQRLLRPDARLIVLQSKSEFAATHNIAFLDAIRETIAQTRAAHDGILRPGLEILPTGSAAIGGATLAAAQEAIRYTEWFTVLTVLGILTLVYRSPLLIALPIVSIGVAVAVSTGAVAWLARWSSDIGADGWGLKIFTTSRIFLFVILFGAGVDYCLFLISRVREETVSWPWTTAIRRGLTGVTAALLGSGLTTVLGLGMLWFGQFGKYHHTGPMIGICLLIGLAVCLTFTPALMQLLGPKVFWPSRIGAVAAQPRVGPAAGVNPTGYWGLIALALTRWPMLTLLLGIGLLLPPAAYGWRHETKVTYDISSQLAPASEPRRGFRVLDEHFGIGEVNPTTVLLIRQQPATQKQLVDETKQMVSELYQIDGVRSVRYADDPLGDFPPDGSVGVFSKEAWRRRALRTHPIAQNYFYSDATPYAGRLIRVDVVMEGNPFEQQTARQVEELGRWLHVQSEQKGSPIEGSKVLLAGTTPSIIDLREVTSDDLGKIKVAVMLAVFIVLVLLIRRFVLCGYLMFTVLLSYYATLGLTVLFFQFIHGGNYIGLDWKLPLFLFVILVAVGQDYNVYLVTRIVEEQRSNSGWVTALRRAVARTGGIITACGLVMAGTFFSMTASAWFPGLSNWFTGSNTPHQGSLRGIVELGFALGLGVLIDTFYVRTLLVPSFVAAYDRVAKNSRTAEKAVTQGDVSAPVKLLP